MTERIKTIIPAGGEATRLRPHTNIKQKPMLPMGSPERRLIDWALDVADYTDRTFVILHHSLTASACLEAYIRSNREGVSTLRDRERMGASSLIDFADIFFEDNPEGDTLIMPADHVIEGLDVCDFHRHHKESGAAATVLTVPRKKYGQYVCVSKDGCVDSIGNNARGADASSAGIYIVRNDKILEWAESELAAGWKSESRSFMGDFIVPAIYRGEVSSYQLPAGGYWDDAGTIGRYYENNMRLSGGENVVDYEAYIHPSAKLSRSVIIGRVTLGADVIMSGSVCSSDGWNLYQTEV